MNFAELNSSMIARAGYDPDANTLQAVMRDGAVFTVENVQPVEYARFMASDSKGKFWHAVFKARAVKTASIPATEPGPVGTPTTNTVADDDCCQVRLQKALRTTDMRAVDRWECTACGCEWRPVTEGTVRLWSPYEEISVIRLRS